MVWICKAKEQNVKDNYIFVLRIFPLIMLCSFVFLISSFALESIIKQINAAKYLLFIFNLFVTLLPAYDYLDLFFFSSDADLNFSKFVYLQF